MLVERRDAPKGQGNLYRNTAFATSIDSHVKVSRALRKVSSREGQPLRGHCVAEARHFVFLYYNCVHLPRKGRRGSFEC